MQIQVQQALINRNDSIKCRFGVYENSLQLDRYVCSKKIRVTNYK